MERETVTEVGRVEKNRQAEIVVQVRLFKGMQLVDIREWAESPDYTGPTKKGVALRKELLPKLISLLEEAVDTEADEEEGSDAR